jgi:lipopolysaccharide export system protein LptA
MAFLFPNRRVILLAALMCALPQAWAILPDSREPISLDADSSEFDREKSTLSFRNVRIRQGMLTISADAAKADDLDFADSSWEFTGNVRIDGDASKIRSEAAILRFRDHRLVRASVHGQPATFERDATEESRALSGSAESIEYDLTAGNLTLSGNARIMDGKNEILGSRLLYELETERLVASSDESGDSRVRITVTPQTLGIADEEPEAGEIPQDTPDAPGADLGQ